MIVRPLRITHKRPDLILRPQAWDFWQGRLSLYKADQTIYNPHDLADNIQTMPDLIKCTRAVVSIRLVNIIQRRPDLIKSTRLLIFSKADKCLTKYL
jgi:hypothetical protein